MKIQGIDTFSRYFRDFQVEYCLIGGGALSLIFQEEGLESRATKDLDIVVLLTPKTKEFVRKLCEFLIEAEYRENFVTQDYCSYRFQKPKDARYPKIIELFTKDKETGALVHSHVQHLSIDNEVSFSSIVMEPEYYDFVFQHAEPGELTHISASAIIPLKAKAFIENKKLLEKGAPGISEDTVRKHGRDVIRLIHDFPLPMVVLPKKIKDDCEEFLNEVENESFNVPQICSDPSFSFFDFKETFIELYLSK